MQFGPDLTTEIIAPANVPFLPGNDVIGFGTAVPAELAAAGIPAAILFYNSGYSPSNTFPSVKYAYISSQSAVDSGISLGGIQVGIGYVANPSVDETAVVLTIGEFIMQAFTTVPFNPALEFNMINFTQTAAVSTMTHGSNPGTTPSPGASQNGLIYTVNAAGNTETGHIGG